MPKAKTAHITPSSLHTVSLITGSMTALASEWLQVQRLMEDPTISMTDEQIYTYVSRQFDIQGALIVRPAGSAEDRCAKAAVLLGDAFEQGAAQDWDNDLALSLAEDLAVPVPMFGGGL